MHIEEEIKAARTDHGFYQLYSVLANSIAPEIFGMEDVKKAILLQMGFKFIFSERSEHGNA